MSWKKARQVLFDWIQMIVVSVVLAIVINLFVLQPVKVEGESMLPTLQDKDFVILSRLGKTFNRELEYGAIVVIDRRTDYKRSLLDDILELGIFGQLKTDDQNLLIKRVIGLPGDTVEIKEGQVFRNGTLLVEPYVKDKIMTSADNTFLVPEDHAFVMGDNRNNSLDSRIIGFVPIENIKGTMLLDVSKLLR